MGKTVFLRKLRIFLACTADVTKERAALRRVANSPDLRAVAESRAIILEVVDWHEAVPDAGRPENVILDQLQPTSWDLFIGILWHRFGTPSGARDSESGTEYRSGTQEEFRLAYRLWKRYGRPRILFYRCDRNSTPSRIDPDQFRLVKEFFAQFAANAEHPGLYHTFQTVKEFEDDVRLHLTKLLLGRRHGSSHRKVTRASARSRDARTTTTRLTRGAADNHRGTLASLVLRGVKEKYYRTLDGEMKSCPLVRVNLMVPDSRDILRIRYVDDLTLYNAAELSKAWQLGEGKCGAAWQENTQQIYASDSNLPGQFLEPMDPSRAGHVLQIQSVISTPVRKDGVTVGVLNLDSTLDGSITKVGDAAVSDLLTTLAGQIGPWLKRRRF